MSFKIEAQARELQGTGASRRLRREGKIPAVVYGDNQQPQAVSVDHKTVFYALEKEAFHTTIIKLVVDGKEQDVIVRDFQMHPFRTEVQHIDFQAVEAGKPLKIRVPLHIVREAGAQNEAPPARSKAPAQAERGGAKRTVNGDDLPPF